MYMYIHTQVEYWEFPIYIIVHVHVTADGKHYCLQLYILRYHMITVYMYMYMYIVMLEKNSIEYTMYYLHRLQEIRQETRHLAWLQKCN